MSAFIAALQALSVQRDAVGREAAYLRQALTKRKDMTYAKHLEIKLQYVQVQLILEELNKVFRLEILNLNKRAANEAIASEVVDFVGAWLTREEANQ